MRDAGWEFKLLGPIEALHDGLHLPVGPAKLRVLLASLLVDANRVVTVETLVDRLWGEDPPGGARNTLKNYILRLRRLLGGTGAHPPLLTRAHGYSIELCPAALDLHRFDTQVERARAAAAADEMGRASRLLGEALRLWRGEALADVPSEVLRRDVAPGLNDRRLSALELRIEADLALGRHESVAAELHDLTGGHPYRERFWAQRMVALYRSGRRGEGLQCYRAARDRLAGELGIDPGEELRDLHRRLLDADPGLLHTGVPEEGGNLPAQTTTFVGRERQLTDIARLVAAGRLVTLTGAGGVGKTRLALRAGAELTGSFPDGVWLADLTSLTDPGLLDQHVAQALGAVDQSTRPRRDVLTDHLRGRRLLLILDNCEHLVGAVAALADALLRAAPGLRVLTTSRHRLGLPGEHPLLVPPLALPPLNDATGKGVADYDAVGLLLDRATASAPDFRITAANEDAVAQLCRRLDGIPLAIELAAVRLSTLSAEEVLERLDDRFRLLAGGSTQTAPPCHRTLHDVIDWSHELCTPAERLLWARLSVFAGGFDLEAAEAVCAAAGTARDDIAGLVSSLVHKSILTVSARGSRTRYRLLELIRHYGARRLAGLGAAGDVRRRHRDHYQRMAASAAAGWFGREEVEWLSKLRRELPNLRAALSFCLTRASEAAHGVAIATDLARARIWFFSSDIGEGRLWLERTCAAAPACPGPLREGAAAMLVFFALVQGDRPATGTFLARFRGLAPGGSPAAGAYIEGLHALLADGDIRAAPLLARARDAFRRAGEYGDAHMATMMWAMAWVFLGDRAVATAARDTYLAEAEESGAAWACTWARWLSGLTELWHGDPGRSPGLLRDALRRQCDIDDRWGPVWTLESLAWAASAAGLHVHAAELLGAASGLRQATGVSLTALRPFHDAHLLAERETRQALGIPAYTAAFDRGTQMKDLTRFTAATPPH
ncbi:BTAD domain-containing putative transcriptional regulator [Sinosporangium siamense]|uniref:SARP family transcriptional regulator n=1 Tax=Sinosporangium siamense TaxID=1367973 RepID=A0A919VFH8_9ACTN|nr:BTAD domain-containing putative transcriptional regulator [Sinosporangium siamense]GII96139.1 SARP family transcriptional regulator [Sinosporangium siamense]